jgi:hypothetical protein
VRAEFIEDPARLRLCAHRRDEYPLILLGVGIVTLITWIISPAHTRATWLYSDPSENGTYDRPCPALSLAAHILPAVDKGRLSALLCK